MRVVTRLFCLGVLLMSVPWGFAEQTFYSALESQASVEAEGGTVDGGQFVPAQVGNGFVSEAAGDVIHFPVEGRLLSLEAGTVELWVKMGLDASAITGELFLFMTYKRSSDAIFLQFDNGGIARMRIKSAGAWGNADSPPLDWKQGETHHVAGSWGPEGLKLYLDGELAASANATVGPTAFAETFEVNNASPPSPNFPTQCVVDELRLSNHQKTPNEFVMNPQPVSSRGRLAVVWAQIKGRLPG